MGLGALMDIGRQPRPVAPGLWRGSDLQASVLILISVDPLGITAIPQETSKIQPRT
ncbi:MAG: hypothetical protein CM15mP77_2780 [Synechococcus sp.]|nr:MAG: hypothetical protein CM15mP77_2780 [Synechococcus sp.]